VVLTELGAEGRRMAVMLGVDPHKRSHTAVAIDGEDVELDAIECVRRRARSRSCSRGRPASRSGRGRSRVLAVSAICSRSSSSGRVNVSWMCPRHWRRGCGCWVRVVRTRTIRTMGIRSRLRRCTRRAWQWSRGRTTRACCGCSQNATRS